MNYNDIIIRPIVSERSMEGVQDKKYTFEVALKANKVEIRKAIEAIFGVKVEKVTTMRMLGKEKRVGVHVGKRPNWKKATVKLTADSKTIELFEGMA